MSKSTVESKIIQLQNLNMEIISKIKVIQNPTKQQVTN